MVCLGQTIFGKIRKAYHTIPEAAPEEAIHLNTNTHAYPKLPSVRRIGNH